MTYRVTAPLVLAQDKEGKVHERYEGAVIDWLSPDQKRHFLEAKLVEEFGATAAEPESEPAPSDGGKPAKNATKPVLIAWIVANVAKDEGVDYTSEELEEWKVPELRDLVDSVE